MILSVHFTYICAMNYLHSDENFLGLDIEKHYDYKNSGFVIQQIPYEHTSSYMEGSAKGPAAIVKASHFVEFYDNELEIEPYLSRGICTLAPMHFEGKVDRAAVNFIEEETTKLLNDKKFVISFGAEHTVTYGLVKAHAKKFPALTVVQLDAHSDLRAEYQGNKYSHASVMARVNDLGLNICQIGIRAQCKEEAELIKSSANIHTYYNHQIQNDENWMDDCISLMTDHVYLTIDADGFDPSVIPNVGTPEPGGLKWFETLTFLKKVALKKKIIGFDIVEVAPKDGSIISEYTLAQLAYKLMGYIVSFDREK
ncbi:MAG: agmatinase [Sphingobacteriales bacterium]|jgi:agmatinase